MSKSKNQERLVELAEQVQGTYPDFVLCMEILPARYGIEDEMIAFMEDNPEATSSDVLEHYDELRGFTI